MQRRAIPQPPDWLPWSVGFAASLPALMGSVGGCVTRTQVHDAQGPTVVLLHGLSRTSRAMEPLAQYLSQAGYRVVNIDYPSRDLPVEALAELASCCAQA